MSEIKRKLATVETILDIKPIENADAIETAIVRGWTVVVKKNEFKVGDKCVFFEVDSFLPIDERFEFLRKSCYRKYNDGSGEGFRLKTVKLRGQLSQGLVLDPHKLFNHDFAHTLQVGDDLTDTLGIVVYDPPVSGALASIAKGSFPTFIPKTDQPRCVSGEVIIQTELGSLTIEEAYKKQPRKVLTYNHRDKILEYKRILSWYKQDNNNDWYQIRTKNGLELKVTSNHPIFMSEPGHYKEVKDIKIGDKILIWN